MEGFSKKPGIFLLGCPGTIFLRFDDILHVPGFYDKESFLDGCLHIQVSEYALNARMRSVWKETKWDIICWKEEWINRKAFILCRVGHVLKIPKTPCYQKC